MADHQTYDQQIKGVYYGLALLAGVTIVEVLFSLFGKGHIFGSLGLYEYPVTVYAVGLILIGLSLYKAYFIIYDFMHLRYEVKGMAMSILLPVILLVWAVIAFFQEGTAWKGNRDRVQEFNERPANMDQPETESTTEVLDLTEGIE
ncbi:MAG: cytochrome C oxidase subunit IV family protein [Bacteroidota bacterium]